MGQVKVRLEGLPEDVESFAALLLDLAEDSSLRGRRFEVLEMSGNYPNRSRSKFVRRYATIEQHEDDE
jgi:hypothetical protein